MSTPSTLRTQFGHFFHGAECKNSKDLIRTPVRASTGHSLRGLAVHETGEGFDGEEVERGREPSDGGDVEKGFRENSPLEDRPGQTENPMENARRNSQDREGTTTDEGPHVLGQQVPDRHQKKMIELQDQTNLLPTRQVITVFAGLTAALFCSLLDQTM